MSKRKRKGCSGSAGTRAKKAAERRRQKQTDLIVLAAATAAFGSASYIVGHLIEAMLNPFARGVGVLLYHQYANSAYKFEIAKQRSAMPDCDRRRENDELRAMRGAVRRALREHVDALALYALKRGRDVDVELSRAILAEMSHSGLAQVHGIRAKLMHLEPNLNRLFEGLWADEKIPGNPPRLKLIQGAEPAPVVTGVDAGP